ncbi:MAG: hypothetical protein PVS3B1_32030 [Ktedonobacteraceae bacterium]
MSESYLSLSLLSSLADVVILTFRIQQFHFFITAGQVIIWSIALLAAILTRRVAGRRMALGSIGILLAALFGVWIATSVIIIGLPYDFTVYDVPLLKAFMGAIVLEIAWYVMTYSSYRVWAGRRKYARSTRAQRKSTS